MSVLKLDPSKTTLIRRQFMTKMRKKLLVFERVLYKVIAEQTELDSKFYEELGPWLFQQAQRKGDAFLETDINGQIWTSQFIRRAYESGAGRAYDAIYNEYESPNKMIYIGRREEFLRQLMGTSGLLLPIVRNARENKKSMLPVLIARVAEEMKGFVNTFVQVTLRIVSDAIIAATGPKSTARSARDKVDMEGRRRAIAGAHNHTVRASAEGMLDGFEMLGVKELQLEAEWTINSDNPCALCIARAGDRYTIEEARGLIPLHENCMCSWTIYKV